MKKSWRLKRLAVWVITHHSEPGLRVMYYAEKTDDIYQMLRSFVDSVRTMPLSERRGSIAARAVSRQRIAMLVKAATESIDAGTFRDFEFNQERPLVDRGAFSMQTSRIRQNERNYHQWIAVHLHHERMVYRRCMKKVDRGFIGPVIWLSTEDAILRTPVVPLDDEVKQPDPEADHYRAIDTLASVLMNFPRKTQPT